MGVFLLLSIQLFTSCNKEKAQHIEEIEITTNVTNIDCLGNEFAYVEDCQNYVYDNDSTHCPPINLGYLTLSEKSKELAQIFCEINKEFYFKNNNEDTITLSVQKIIHSNKNEVNIGRSKYFLCEEDTTKNKQWCYDFENFNIQFTSSYDTLRFSFDIGSEPTFFKDLEGQYVNTLKITQFRSTGPGTGSLWRSSTIIDEGNPNDGSLRYINDSRYYETLELNGVVYYDIHVDKFENATFNTSYIYLNLSKGIIAIETLEKEIYTLIE